MVTIQSYLFELANVKVWKVFQPLELVQIISNKVALSQIGIASRFRIVLQFSYLHVKVVWSFKTSSTELSAATDLTWFMAMNSHSVNTNNFFVYNIPPSTHIQKTSQSVGRSFHFVAFILRPVACTRWLSSESLSNNNRLTNMKSIHCSRSEWPNVHISYQPMSAEQHNHHNAIIVQEIAALDRKTEFIILCSHNQEWHSTQPSNVHNYIYCQRALYWHGVVDTLFRSLGRCRRASWHFLSMIDKDFSFNTVWVG